MEKSKKTSKKQGSTTDDLQNCGGQMSNSLTNSTPSHSTSSTQTGKTQKTQSQNKSSH